MHLSKFRCFFYFSFLISTNLYLSIKTIVLKLSFSYESGKILGARAPTLSEASKIWGSISSTATAYGLEREY